MMFPYRLGDPIRLFWKEKWVEELTHEELLAAVYQCWAFRVERYGPAIQGMVIPTHEMTFAAYAAINGDCLNPVKITEEELSQAWGKMLEVYVAQQREE